MKFFHYIIAFLIACSMQLTDFKMGPVKVGEFFSLLLIFYCIFNIKNLRIPRLYKNLFLCFLFWGISSLMVLLWIDLYPPKAVNDFLKQTGWITVSRLLQMFGCLAFSLFIHNTLIKHSRSFNDRFLKCIDSFMFFFFVFFFFMFVLSFFGIDSPFIHSTNRLRGGYIEGGPFGLFVAFYFLFRTILWNFNIKWLILTLFLIIASQSKAAILFLFAILILYLLLSKQFKIKNIVIYGFISIAMLVLLNRYVNFEEKIIAYWQDYDDIEYAIAQRNDDPTLVMGRIAAAHIAPNIIKDNILLGVGLGNYSLVRNNPEYRGIFPVTNEWDLTGLGGIINIFLEVGIIGLLFFIYPFFKLWKETSSKIVQLFILLFMLVQIFGVQAYFQYLWFIVGIMTAIHLKSYDSIICKRTK